MKKQPLKEVLKRIGGGHLLNENDITVSFLLKRNTQYDTRF